MPNSPATPAHDLLARASGVYDVITGQTTLYTNGEDGFMSADKSDFDVDEQLYEVNAYDYIANAAETFFQTNDHGDVTEAIVVIDHSPSTIIDLLENKIISRYGDYAVTIEFTDYYLKLDLLEELKELHENALI